MPERSASDAGPQVFVGLEGLRGVAALLVVVRHGEVLFGLPARSAHLAVDVFFVLSGFVLAHAYGEGLARGLGAVRFLQMRLIRLWPLYLLGLALAFGEHLAWRLTGGDGGWSGSSLLTSGVLNSLFLPAHGAAPDLFPLDPPAWSLFFELLANLAYAVVAPRLSTRALAIFTLCAACGLAAVGLRYGGLAEGWRWQNGWVGLVRVGFAFPAGVLLYRLRPWRLPRLLPEWSFPLLLGAILLGDAGALQPAYEVAVPLGVAPLMVALGAAARPGRRLGTLFRWLGAASYGIYVLHVPALAALNWALARCGLEPTEPLIGIACLALLAQAAVWLDRAYDRPTRAFLSVLVRRTRSPDVRAGYAPPPSA